MKNLIPKLIILSIFLHLSAFAADDSRPSFANFSQHTKEFSFGTTARLCGKTAEACEKIVTRQAKKIGCDMAKPVRCTAEKRRIGCFISFSNCTGTRSKLVNDGRDWTYICDPNEILRQVGEPLYWVCQPKTPANLKNYKAIKPDDEPATSSPAI